MRTATIILASLLGIAEARGDDTVVNRAYNERLGSDSTPPFENQAPVDAMPFCQVQGSSIVCNAGSGDVPPYSIINAPPGGTGATSGCPSGWLPVTVGGQTWCARELRAPGGQDKPQ